MWWCHFPPLPFRALGQGPRKGVGLKILPVLHAEPPRDMARYFKQTQRIIFKAQVCSDFAHEYGPRYPFSPNEARAIHCERHGKMHELLIVGMRFPPSGFYSSVLNKRRSQDSKMKVNLGRIKCPGVTQRGTGRIHVSPSVFQADGFWSRLKGIFGISKTMSQRSETQTLHEDSSDENELLDQM